MCKAVLVIISLVHRTPFAPVLIRVFPGGPPPHTDIIISRFRFLVKSKFRCRLPAPYPPNPTWP